MLTLYYEDKTTDNVLTKKSLELIREFEESLYNNTIYQSKMCLLKSSQGLDKCVPPMSLTRFFDGTLSGLSPVFNDPNFDNISGVLSLAKKIPVAKVVLDYHLSKDAIIEPNQAQASIIRSMVYTGSPLKGFSNNVDRVSEQFDKWKVLAKDAFGDQLDSTYKNNLGGKLRFRYNMRPLFVQSMQSQVVQDLMLVMASFMFIFIFMLCQTQSLWITCWALFSILSSFFGANLFYRIVLDYRYVGVFHVLSVFIVAGIGADDVFVFLDTWRAAKDKYPDHTLLARLSFAYRRAAGSMLITSLTTFVAFMANALSPLLSVSSFGVFSALIILVNYISVIVFFPTVVITYELYWSGCKWPCCMWKCCISKVTDEGEHTSDEDAKAGDCTQMLAGFIGERFYSKVVTHKVLRWVTVVVFSAWIAVSIYFATNLRPDDEQVEIMGPGTNWYDVRQLSKEAFPPSNEDRVMKVYIVWGLRNQDRSTCHFTDFMCTGKAVFDNGFDMNSPPCQIAMLKLCKTLNTLSKDKIDAMKVRLNPLTGKPVVECYMDAMETFYKKESLKPRYPVGTNFDLPLTSAKVKTLMEYNPGLYNMSRVTDMYYRYFEVAVAYWLTNGNTSRNNLTFVTFSQLLGGEEDASGTADATFQGGTSGNRLLYQAVVVDSTLTNKDLAYSSGIPVYNAWQDFLKEQMKYFPPSCRNAFQTTPRQPFAWHWMKVQKVLVQTAIRGIGLSLGLTLAILLIMIGNWIIALLCIFIISCITVGVVGFIPMLGWKLGVLESLNLTLVVGLAVDYVVHLAHGYVTCPATDRQQRLKHTLRQVGISVLSGACTTLGSSIFMFAAKILFFVQFGVFMFCTIGVSILFALLLFVTILGLIGPQGSSGSLVPLYRYIKHKISGRGATDVTCDKCDGKGFSPSDRVLKPQEVHVNNNETSDA